MSDLALLGGKPIREQPFPIYNTIGPEEKQAVMDVLDSGILSGFLGTWSPEFYGGKRVQQLEREWEENYDISHAITVNSGASALNIAIGASGVGPGDEVITSPFTMSASAACILVYNAIPVFADIAPTTFSLDPESVEHAITPKTKAIVAVDLFGHPFEADKIMSIAREHDLLVIEDAAQAYGSFYHGQPSGTLGDIGVFSLNVHKIINCGEGGVCVTRDDELAERMRLIRNHGEEVVKNKGTQNIVNMVGFNYRMGEIEAAISSEQLKKLEEFVHARVENAEYLTERLHNLPGITPPVVKSGIRHSYNGYPIRFNASKAGLPRNLFVDAIRAEGIPIGAGYVEPIYLQPLYQQRIAYGAHGCPFTCPHSQDSFINYEKGICPISEHMYEKEWIGGGPIHMGITEYDLNDIVNAYDKILDSSSELVEHASNTKKRGC